MIISSEEYRERIKVPDNLNPKEYILLPDLNLIISIDTFFSDENWWITHQKSTKEHAGMPNLSEFLDLLKLLHEENALYADNSIVPLQRCKELFIEIAGLRRESSKIIYLEKDKINGRVIMQTPKREEWLDEMYLPNEEGGLERQTDHLYTNERLTPFRTEPLGFYLGKTREISLIDLIYRHTKQGLPVIAQKRGNLKYSPPKFAMVANFRSTPFGLSLDCDELPMNHNLNRKIRKKYALN